MINEDFSINANIDRYQAVLEHALSNVDFGIATGICMVPSNLNLSIIKTVGYNDKLLIINIIMKIASTKDIKKNHKNNL